MANFTPQEQLMLELINRARMDPAGEAARYGIALNEGPPGITLTATPKQVLAGNDKLGLAADKHSDWMITNDIFSQTETPGSPHFYATGSFDRMDKALYTGAYAQGENISYIFSAAALNTTQAMVAMERKLFVDSGYAFRGHRVNILDANYDEVGIGQFNGTWTQGGKNYHGSAVTQDFGGSPLRMFITGVVYNDTVTNDNFFTVGEQTVGRLVDGSGASDTTGAGGGYELEYSTAGSKSVTFHLATGNVIVRLALGATNIKVDIVNGHELWTNASLSAVSTTATELHALGISGMTLTGSGASEKIYGNNGANILKGLPPKSWVTAEPW